MCLLLIASIVSIVSIKPTLVKKVSPVTHLKLINEIFSLKMYVSGFFGYFMILPLYLINKKTCSFYRFFIE